MEIKKIDLDQSTVENNPITSDQKIQTNLVNKNNYSTNSMPKNQLIVLSLMFLLAAGLGAYTGAWVKASKTSGSMENPSLAGIQADVPEEGVKVGDIYGSADEKGFKDSATGVLDKGGFNGEGTHKLLRVGGDSQTVYLTSSVIDLDQLVGHQVTIWGETFKGQKVSWLMDVGRAKVEVLNAPMPE